MLQLTRKERVYFLPGVVCQDRPPMNIFLRKQKCCRKFPIKGMFFEGLPWIVWDVLGGAVGRVGGRRVHLRRDHGRLLLGHNVHHFDKIFVQAFLIFKSFLLSSFLSC